MEKLKRDLGKYVVVKRNDLNEQSPRDMSLQQLRFIAIYLGVINPQDTSTRLVRFSVDDFREIMELGRVNINSLRNAIDGLLSKVTGIVIEGGGELRFQYFKRCKIDVDENAGWYIEIDAHDDALPIFFDLKRKYFKYRLWNGLRLTSVNQFRFYEILKQHEWQGKKVISVEHLRYLLGIEQNEYRQYRDFKRRVLDSCQEALAKYTDICFTYEPHGKKGRGGKILELQFTINENRDYQNFLALEKLVKTKPDSVTENVVLSIESDTVKPNELPNKNAETKYDTDLTDDEHSANFELFWNAYPDHKKAGRLLAEEEWAKLPRSQMLFAEIMSGLESAKKSKKWTTDEGIYVHEPTNWIRQERWRDSYRDTDETLKAQSKKAAKQNYTGRKWDYDKLMQLEEKYIDKRLSK